MPIFLDDKTLLVSATDSESSWAPLCKMTLGGAIEEIATLITSRWLAGRVYCLQQ